MRYILSYDAHRATRKDFELIEAAIREVDADADDILESVWVLTSGIQSAADLITEVSRRLRRRRREEGSDGLSVEFYAARIFRANAKWRNVGV